MPSQHCIAPIPSQLQLAIRGQPASDGLSDALAQNLLAYGRSELMQAENTRTTNLSQAKDYAKP